LDALEKAFAITSVSHSPGNMKRLRDSTIACLAISDMRPVDHWKVSPEKGEMVAVAPAFASYATTLPDGRIAIHRYPDHKLQREFPGKGKPVSSILRFSPDGTRVAAAYGSGAEWQMMLWDSSGVLPPHDLGQGVNQAFAFFPGGSRCAIGRPDGGLVVADVASGKPLQQLILGHVPQALAVSRDGKWIAACFTTTAKAAGSVAILDAASGARIASLPWSGLSVAWSSKEDSLAVGCTDRALRVWHDLNWSSAPLELGGASGHTEAVDSVAWSPDGRLLLSQSGDGTMRLWDPSQGAHLGMHLGNGSNLELVEKDSRLFVMTRGDEEFRVMEVVAGDVCYRGRKHSGDRGVADGAWNPKGNLLATSGDDGVRFWNREGRQLAYLKIERARGLAFSDDSFFVGSATGIHRYRMSEEKAAGELVIRFQTAEAVGALESCEQLSLWRDGGMLAAVARGSGRSEPAGIWILDLKGGAGPRPLEMPAEVAYCSFSPDGQWVAAGTADADGVRIWSMTGNAPAVDLPSRGTARVVFSPDSKRLVACDTDVYRFWKTGSWEVEREIPSQMGGTSGIVCFSPRPTVLIIAYHRAELKVIDVDSLQEVCSPDFDRETPLCFDSDGRLMITVSPSGGVFFWKLDAVRANLLKMGLDWKSMKLFDPFDLPLLDRVVLPSSGS
jgi:WD40 repeat protein